MSTRDSGRKRVPADLYETPAWLIDPLDHYLKLKGRDVAEVAAGAGKMVMALRAKGANVDGFDLYPRKRAERSVAKVPIDFLKWVPAVGKYGDIITNPPYGPRGKTAEKFIEHGLFLIERSIVQGMALLLSVDFDSAKTRAHLFRDCENFCGKIVLLKRIEWFARKPGAAGPSVNHAWYLWGYTADFPYISYWPVAESQ